MDTRHKNLSPNTLSLNAANMAMWGQHYRKYHDSEKNKTLPFAHHPLVMQKMTQGKKLGEGIYLYVYICVDLCQVNPFICQAMMYKVILNINMFCS